MATYTPSFTININGTDYKDDVINTCSITIGRNDIFDTTLPGYCIIELVNLSGTSPAINLLETIEIKTTDSLSNDVTLFTGEVITVNNRVIGAGDSAVVNSLTIFGTGSLAKLVRKNAGTNSYPQELDGERIERILQDALFTAWEDLPNTLQWSEIDASATWATYGQQGIDVVDPGRYELLARTGEVDNASDLARIAEQSGLGYLYENHSDGTIGYADAERRTNNITSNTIALNADFFNAELQTRLSTQDVINSVVIQYDDPPVEVQAINDQSVETYGLVESIISTQLAESADATEQASRLVALRGNPNMNFDAISLNLVNDNIDNTTRDLLLGISMDSYVLITNMPEGIISTGVFDGFCEGWSWELTKNSLLLTMRLSNAIFSAQEVQWEDFSPATTQWQNLSNDLQWLDLAIG